MKLMIKNFWMFFSLLLAVSLITACDDDDPGPVNEEELITTVNVTFTNQANAGDVVQASFVDLDGPGGNAPVITNPSLAANANYDVRVEFLNESETPAEDITEEVVEEGEEHQVFMIVTGGLNVTYSYGDQDASGNPIGVEGSITTGATSDGNLNLVLRHEPAKEAAGVSDGDITNAGGETDISVNFTVTIQ